MLPQAETSCIAGDRVTPVNNTSYAAAAWM
jgi:hypothetical protein